ncbi:MAG: hypothetical protein AAF206_11170 [Bacteroidota bacterium]
MAPSHQARSIPAMLIRSFVLIAVFAAIFFSLKTWYIESTPETTSKRVEHVKSLAVRRTAGFIQKDSLLSLLKRLENKESMESLFVIEQPGDSTIIRMDSGQFAKDFQRVFFNGNRIEPCRIAMQDSAGYVEMEYDHLFSLVQAVQ